MNQELIQKIKDYYEPIYENNQISIKIHDGGNRKHFSITDKREMYLGFGNKANNLEEAIQMGHLKISANDLFKSIFPDEWAKIKSRYEGEKTDQYFQRFKDNIGFIETKNGYDEEKLSDSHIIKHIPKTNMENVEVGKLDNNTWVAQYGFPVGIDDYNITRMFFGKKPTENDIRLVKVIEDIEFYFFRNGYDKATFTCWECGHHVHWLDVDGELEEKFEKLKERFCGFCDS